MIARALSLIAGAGILLAVAHVTIMATGGYEGAHAYLTLAIAFGVACGSVCCGMAWAGNRRSLAALFVVCIVGGEAFGFMQTANRLIAASEAAQAPLREHVRTHAKALQRVEDAKAALAKPVTSARLQKAEAAKARADEAVTAQSSLRDCRDNCRQLLQAQVNAAAEEIANARSELDAVKATARAELQAAQAALDGLAAPVSPTPLADRTGIPAWALDLLTASLGSLAANGLACCLMIFGAHHGVHRVEIVSPAAATKPEPIVATVLEAQPVDGDPGTFLVAALEPGDSVREDDVCDEYDRWCRERGLMPIPRPQFKAAFLSLCDQSGFKRSRGKIHGMQLVEAKPRRALGRMASVRHATGAA